MIFDSRCTIRNENRYQDEVENLGSVAFFPAMDRNMFTMNMSVWYR